MASKLFVGGLPYSFTSDQLAQLFSQVGTVVSANVIIDRFSGRSKGFGFVEMDSDEAAQKAIQTLNGNTIENRSIVVNVARPMEKREDRGGFSRGNFNRDRRH